MPADDLTDPAPATTFAHLDATTVLSRAIAELGIYPAVDPLDSTSRIMDPNIVGSEHYDIARGVQKILQVGDLFPFLALSSLFDFSFSKMWPIPRLLHRTTSPCRISLPFWVWMSYLRRTNLLWPVLARSSVSCPSPSRLPRSSLAIWVNWCP